LHKIKQYVKQINITVGLNRQSATGTKNCEVHQDT